MSTSSNTQHELNLIFHALADPTRRALLNRLTAGPAIVRELAEPFAQSVPAICKHLKVLEKARLISRLVDGRVHHCSLHAQPLMQLASWLENYRPFWNDTLSSLEMYAASQKDKS